MNSLLQSTKNARVLPAVIIDDCMRSKDNLMETLTCACGKFSSNITLPMI